jgi:hypothetical protein
MKPLPSMIITLIPDVFAIKLVNMQVTTPRLEYNTPGREISVSSAGAEELEAQKISFILT